MSETCRLDETHDPALPCWVPGAAGHAEFPIQNLPLGIFSTGAGAPRPGAAIGDHVLDLAAIAPLLPEEARQAMALSTLNALFALPKAARVALRRTLSRLLSDSRRREALSAALHPAGACTLHLPATIGDYTDFYAGIHHATHVGRLMRPDDPLLPNYKWVPIGYHGRTSSIRPSGEPVRRPKGQLKAADGDAPVFGPSARLDYEMELGVWIAGGNALGDPIPVASAGDHVAGLCLLNDWSARDIQAWEYRPLGPFMAKNFHTTISPWVITAEALKPFRIPQPARPEGDPAPLPYLIDSADQEGGAFAIELEALLTSARMRKAGIGPVLLGRAPASSLYWTVAQLIAHHSAGGCNLNPGDLFGSGTISNTGAEERGCLLEITEGGSKQITLPTGERRGFLADGDELTLRATARASGAVPIGFGPCTARVVPA